MEIITNPDIDVLTIRLSDAPIEESDEETGGVITDYNEDGQVVGFEILNASERVQNPRSVEWALAG